MEEFNGRIWNPWAQEVGTPLAGRWLKPPRPKVPEPGTQDLLSGNCLTGIGRTGLKLRLISLNLCPPLEEE